MLETGNNISTSQRLSIRITADGFSFYIHTAEQRLLSVRSFPWRTDLPDEQPQKTKGCQKATQLRQVLKDNKLISPTCSSVNILVCTPSTRIPLEGFHKEDTENLYRLIYPSSQGVQVHYNVLPSLEVVELFALEPEISDMLAECYADVHFYGKHTLLLERLARLVPAMPPRQRLFVYTDGNGMSTFAFNGKSLRFANSYPAENIADITYFLLYIWKTLELQAETDECILMGGGTVSHLEIISSLRRYLRNVSVLAPSRLFNLASIPRSIQQPPLDVYPLILNATYPL